MEKNGHSVATLLRLKAENLIKNRPVHVAAHPDESEILKLLHELEVYGVELELQNEEFIRSGKEKGESIHQNRFTDEINQRLVNEIDLNWVELEIQNEELKLSAATQETASLYSDLFDFATAGYLLLSEKGEIIDINYSFARLIGKDRFKLKQSRLGFFVAESDRPVYNDFLSVLFKNKTKQSCKLTLDLNEYHQIKVLLSGIPAQNERQCLITVADLTPIEESELHLEEILRETKEKQSAIIQTALDAFYITDLQGCFLEVNDTYCRMTGYTRVQLLTMRIQNMEMNESETEIAKHIQRIKTLGEDRFETRHRCKDGRIIDVEASVQYRNSDGGQFVTFLHEITERKQAEEKLRQSEERYKSIFQNNHSVLLLIHPETGKIADANPAACDFYGWSHDELCTKNISEINTLSKEEVTAEMQKARIEKRNHFYFRHRLFTNEIRDVEVFSGPIQYGDTILLYSIIHDITDRIQAEEAVAKSEKKLAEIYASMSEGLAIHELIYDATGKAVDYVIAEVNPAYEKITGIKMNEVIGKKASDLYSTATAPFLEVYSQVESTGISASFDTYFPPMDKHFSISVFSPGKGRFVTLFRDITPQKQAEATIRNSEYKFRNLVNEMEVGVLINGPQSEVLLANPRALELLGLTEDQILGKTPFDSGWQAIHEDGSPFPGESYPAAQVIVTGKAVRNVVMGINQPLAGKHVWFLVNAQPQLGESGEVIQVVTTFVDITALKTAQRELKESELRLKYHFENSPLAVVEWNNNFVITQWSIEAERIFGWKKEEIIGQRVDQINLVYTDDVAMVTNTMERLINGEINTVVNNNRNVTKTGEIINCIWYNSILMDKCGKMASMMALVQDITLQKQIEENLVKSEEKFSLIYEKSPYAISLSNIADGRIEDVNEAFEKIFEYSKEEVIGKRSDELGINIYQEPGMPILEEIRNKGFAHDIEGIFHRKSGDSRTLRYDIDIVESGNQKYLLNTAEDITARKETEQALRESEFFFRESQQAAFIGSFKTDFEVGQWDSSEVLDQIFGIDKSYVRNLEGWLNIVHPEDREMINHYLRHEVLEQRIPVNKEHRIIRKNDGQVRWVHVLGQVDIDLKDKVSSLFGTIQDVTERKKREEVLQKLNKILTALGNSSLAMAQAQDEGDYLKKVCQIVVEDTEFAMVWIGYAEEDEGKTIRPVASAGFNDNYLETIRLSWGDNEFGRGPTGVAIRTGNMSICNNMLTDPAFAPWRQQASSRGYASSIVFPLKSAGKTFGAITIYSTKPDSFLTDEIKLLSKLAGDLAHGITTIRLRAANQLADMELIRSNSLLEEHVKNRTAELMSANETLKLTEEKYRTVADFATNWEFWISPDDQIIYCSPSCEQITGYTTTEFVANSQLIQDIIHPDDIHSYLDHKAMESEANICAHEILYRIYRKDGMIRWISHYCQPVYDESGNFRGIRGSNKDITARIKMEELLKTSNRKYSLLSANITDGIFIYRDDCFEYINSAMIHIFGYKEHEFNRMNLRQLVRPDYLEELAFMDQLRTPQNKIRNVELECIRKDHSSVFVEFLFNYVAKEKVIYGVAHDITDKKQIQKNIVKAIIQTEEKERSYFSKELHDGVGPLLSAIKLYLQWSERSRSDQSREEIIRKAEEILEETLVTVKEISNKLSPHLLTNHGLVSAIQSFIGKLEETSAIHISFETNLTGRFDGDIEAAIYRAVIECINNTIKYAGAKNIRINLEVLDNQLRLQYRDDGIGFDLAETLAVKKGLGLFNLQNRIHNIGGKIILFSEPGAGVDYQIIVNL